MNESSFLWSRRSTKYANACKLKIIIALAQAGGRFLEFFMPSSVAHNSAAMGPRDGQAEAPVV